MKKIILIIAVSILVIVLGGGISFLLLKDSLNFQSKKIQVIQYEKYTDSELGFEINYPKGWQVDKGKALDLSGYKYIKFSGELEREKRINSKWCDPEKYPAFLEIEQGDYFISALGSINNEKDLEKFLNSMKGVMEKIPLHDKNNLLISRAYTGSGMCFHALYLGWVVTDAGRHYRIIFFGDEDRYDLIKPLLESFKLKN